MPKKRRPCSDARKAFERLLKERHPEFVKQKGGPTFLSTWSWRPTPQLELFVVFQSHSKGQGAFTVEVGSSEDGATPSAVAGPQERNTRFRLGQLIDGRDRWWDLRPPAPKTQRERELVLPTLSPHARLLLAPATAEGDAFDLLWEASRDELVPLLSDAAYEAMVASAAKDAVEALERQAMPWFAARSRAP